ncbi:MAG: cytidine deaminase [Anaerolineales bacterium]|nr:cytidine deaminase [Anaerolineales bacterium]
MDYDSLIAKAMAAREKAHAPYSQFAVGAALLAKSGRVYTGCNVENASYGLSICAERTAVFKAVSEGERDFEAIAVVTDKGVTPCGACRQVLMEFGEDIRVIVADEAGGYRVFGLQELLPEAFNSEDLK